MAKPCRRHCARSFGERGLRVQQCYGTADLGLIAYESSALEGLIIDEGVYVEIVRPGTGETVGEGEVGEVVVTNLDANYPLIRFATGDLSAYLPGISPCGRTNLRIRGWMGRADQTAKVRGMFIHPEQVDKVVKRHARDRARAPGDRLGRANRPVDLAMRVRNNRCRTAGGHRRQHAVDLQTARRSRNRDTGEPAQ